MKEQVIEGVSVLVPRTREQLRRAVESGRPFLAPEKLAEEFALPRDPHVVNGEDVGVLGDSAEQ